MASVSSTANDGAQARFYTKVLAESEKEKQAEIKRIREGAARELQRVEDSYKAATDKNTVEAETNLNALRGDSQKAISQEREHSRESLDQLKDQLYNQKGLYESDRNQEKKGVETFVNDSIRRRELDQKSASRRETQLVNQLEEVSHDNNEKLRQYKEHQLEAFDNVNQNNKKLLQEQQKEAGAQATEMVNKNTERDHQFQHEIQQINQSYQTQREKMSQDVKDGDKLNNNLYQEALTDRERHHTELFKNQNREHTQELANLEKSIARYKDNVDHISKGEESRRDQVLSNEITQSSLDKEKSLQSQAKNYQTVLTEQRKNDQDSLSQMQASIQKAKTTADINLVSPAAEEAMRKSLSKNFEKTFSTEREKHQQVTGALYEQKRGELTEAKDDYQNQLAKANREFVRSQASDRAEYYNTILDSEYDTNYKIQDKDSQNSRQTEALHHHYARLLDKQKKDYDNAYDTSRITAQNSINELRQDSEIALRMAHKEYASKSSIMAKDFEKKLAEQKENYEIKLDDTKTQAATDIRATELKGKIDMENQAKTYETKLAQNQAQSKERERTISQNFQDELDRTRRAYELVIQKKN